MSQTESKRDRAVTALLSEPTIETAAQTAGVSRATLTRWMREPDFQAACRDARRAALDGAIGRLSSSVALAVETLESVMRDPEAGAVARVSAARCVLDSALRASAIDDLAARVADLEARRHG